MASTDSEVMKGDPTGYLPAAGRDWALPLYDPLTKLLGADVSRKVLLDHAAIRSNHRVLDIGCGTGTLVTLIKQLHSDVAVLGLDPDPKALALARRKAERAAVSIRLDQGFSNQLPYAEASFDRVFSSFMFHHLHAELREKTLCEVRRVLAPGGRFHMLDFERPESQAGGWFAGLLHAKHRLRDNAEGRLLTLMHQAGFVYAKKVIERPLLFGLLRIGYYQASTPAV